MADQIVEEDKCALKQACREMIRNERCSITPEVLRAALLMTGQATTSAQLYSLYKYGTLDKHGLISRGQQDGTSTSATVDGNEKVIANIQQETQDVSATASDTKVESAL